MERTKINQPFSYDQDNEPIVVSKALLDLLLKQKNPGDLIALYIFYYYTAKWQRTNQPKATTEYTASGLKWTEARVRKNKQILVDLKLVKDIVVKLPTSRITGHYIKLEFIWSKFHPTVFSQGEINHTVKSHTVNSLSSNNINALSTNKELYGISDDKITAKRFDSFWKLYPRKAYKGAALTSWFNICSRENHERPTWAEMKRAIIAQSKSEQWRNPKLIPHPSTWLNQFRWLDDADEMMTSKKLDLTEQYDESQDSDSTMDVIRNLHRIKD